MKAIGRGPDRDLRRLVRSCGVQTEFVDGTGTRRRASNDTLVAVLRGLGVPIETAHGATEALQWHRERARAGVLPAVVVGDAEEGVALALRTPPSGSFRLWVLEETGAERSGEGTLEDLPADRHGRRMRVRVPAPGVHRLVLEYGSARHEAILLARPQPHTLGGRRWGAFLPLQLLGRPDSRTVGSLDRAAMAMEWLTGLGGQFLGVLPALAGSRDEASPYSPLSRCFWSELYLAAEWLPLGCPPAPMAAAGSPTTRSTPPREVLPPGHELDTELAWRASDAILDHVLKWLATPEAVPAQRALSHFAGGSARVRAYAAYRALADVHGPDWRRWPEGSADRQAALTAADPGRARRHLVAQWLATQQWQRLAGETRAHGADLYLDLPLGTPAASFDAWWWREEFVEGCSIGAPPDRFFPEGQDWGLAPPHPRGQRLGGYLQLRAALRHHLRVARLLRVDHVMGLHRLYWVPAGASPHEGTYVRYPAVELHAVHAIEAWRRDATLVGEDLGTVPTTVRAQMRQRGMRRMWIALAELNADPAAALPAPEPSCLASLSTHDMPTFCGWWNDADIHRRAALGRLAAHRIESDKAEREPSKQALLRFLGERDLLRGMAAHELAGACLRWLADSPAELLVVNPEDLQGETLSINIPGAAPTGTVAPANWLRGAPGALEDWRQDTDLNGRLREIDARRRAGAGVAC